MDERGFLIFATNHEEIAAAVTLAYSIGSSNKGSKVSLVCPIDKITISQEEPFDAIIDIPYRYGDKHKNESIWQVYWSTPYEHTIVIDCNSIVKQNFGSTWDYLIDHHDMCVGKSITDFRLSEKIDLEVLNEYNLSFANSNIFYFKKDSDLALKFFKLLDPYLQSYREVFSTYIQPQHHPKTLDLNLMFSIVLQHLDIYDESIPEADLELRQLILAPWAYYTYARCLSMFQGTFTDSGYTIETEAESRNAAKSVSQEMKSIGDTFMILVTDYLKAENPETESDQTKLSSKVRAFGGGENRGSN